MTNHHAPPLPPIPGLSNDILSLPKEPAEPTTLSPSNGHHPIPRPASHRKSGPPRGNQNARKHGFYSSALSKKERTFLYRALNIDGLAPEIALLRVKLLRLVSYPDVPPDLLVRVTRTLTRMFSVQQQSRPKRRRFNPPPQRRTPIHRQ